MVERTNGIRDTGVRSPVGPPNLMRILKLIITSILIGAPTSFMLTFLSTPLLWKLEAILGVELAGHHGPSDWIFILNLVLFPCLIFLLLKKLASKRAGFDHS